MAVSAAGVFYSLQVGAQDALLTHAKITDHRIETPDLIEKFELEVIEDSTSAELAPLGSLEWKYTVIFKRTGKIHFNFIDSNAITKGELTEFPQKFKMGWNSVRINIVDRKGRLAQLQLQYHVEPISHKPPTGPALYLVAGPSIFSRSIERSGGTLQSAGSFKTYVAGVRGIARWQVFKNFTDRSLGKHNLYLDGSFSLGKTFGGSQEIAGMPFWMDGRLTGEIFEYRSIRFEMGAGVMFYRPGDYDPDPGDLTQYVGFLLSGRFRVAVSPKFALLSGILFPLPSSAETSEAALTTSPLELFLSASFVQSASRFFEIRFKYFAIPSSGSVAGAADFSRSETFLGSEFLWIWRL